MDITKINTGNTVPNKDYNKAVNDKVTKIEGQNKESSKENVAEKKESEFQPEQLKPAVDLANKMLFKNNTHLKFEIHEKTKEVMVRIVRDDTGEVVKEVPPEKMLDMVAKIWETLGILVDEKR